MLDAGRLVGNPTCRGRAKSATQRLFLRKNKESVKKKRPNTENMQPRIQIEENRRPKKKKRQRKEQQEEKPRNSQDEDVSNAPEFSLAKIEYKLNTSNIINPSQDFFVIP